jgi:hypothetical protein
LVFIGGVGNFFFLHQSIDGFSLVKTQWVGEWGVVGKELFRRIGRSTPDAWLNIKMMCIVCAAMDVAVQQRATGLHSAVAGVRARMAALEWFIGCGVGGAATGGKKLEVYRKLCSEAVNREYSVGKEVQLTVYAYVYADFAVLLVGSPPRVYKSEGLFDHGVGRDVGEFFGITGDDLGALTLLCYNKAPFNSPDYAEAFSLVRAPWDGEWTVGGEVKVEGKLFGRGEAGEWVPQCVEIVMDSDVRFKRADGSETVWPIQPALSTTEFNVLVPCAGHASIPLRFAVCAEDYNRLRLDVVRGVGTCVKYTLERKARAVLRRFPPLLAGAAAMRQVLPVTEEWEGDRSMKGVFAEWRKRVEVCVHDHGGVLLKLGPNGMSYKPDGSVECKGLRSNGTSYDLEAPYRCYDVFRYRMSFDLRNRPMYRPGDGEYFDVSFALAGVPARVVLVGYCRDPDRRWKRLAFRIPFVPCKVWEGDWSVQQLTSLDPPPEVVEKWNTVCDEINLTDGAWMKMTNSSGVTTAEWHIHREPEPLWFRAFQKFETVACSVVVEDYNHIKLQVATETYPNTTGRIECVRVPTVEYTLARKRG